jgi:hypothetical protein
MFACYKIVVDDIGCCATLTPLQDAQQLTGEQTCK